MPHELDKKMNMNCIEYSTQHSTGLEGRGLPLPTILFPEWPTQSQSLDPPMFTGRDSLENGLEPKDIQVKPTFFLTTCIKMFVPVYLILSIKSGLLVFHIYSAPIIIIIIIIQFILSWRL